LMARRFSLPFKTVLGSEVEPASWHYRTGNGEWLRVAESIPGWDYLSMLELHRDIAIDASRVKTVCDLSGDADLILSVTLSSPIARFRRVMACVEVPREKNVITVEFTVPSADLAGRLVLDTEVLLASGKPSSNKRFAAQHSGSRLYSEACTVYLEGSGSRMPMEVASFSRELPWLGAPKAPWHVQCGSEDLHLPIMQELRVFLNSDTPLPLDSLLKDDQNLHDLLKAEVAKRLLEVAFADTSFVQGENDFGEGSIGQAASRLMRVCFPHQTRSEAFALASRHPARFEAIVRSRFTSNHD
jgi:hypothetical protein